MVEGFRRIPYWRVAGFRDFGVSESKAQGSRKSLACTITTRPYAASPRKVSKEQGLKGPQNLSSSVSDAIPRWLRGLHSVHSLHQLQSKILQLCSSFLRPVSATEGWEGRGEAYLIGSYILANNPDLGFMTTVQFVAQLLLHLLEGKDRSRLMFPRISAFFFFFFVRWHLLPFRVLKKFPFLPVFVIVPQVLVIVSRAPDCSVRIVVDESSCASKISVAALPTNKPQAQDPCCGHFPCNH